MESRDEQDFLCSCNSIGNTQKSLISQTLFTSFHILKLEQYQSLLTKTFQDMEHFKPLSMNMYIATFPVHTTIFSILNKVKCICKLETAVSTCKTRYSILVH